MTPHFSQATRREFYSLRNGSALARVEMEGENLSQVVVTTGDAAEAIDNRAYMPILKGRAEALSQEEYLARRARMMVKPACH